MKKKARKGLDPLNGNDDFHQPEPSETFGSSDALDELAAAIVELDSETSAHWAESAEAWRVWMAGRKGLQVPHAAQTIVNRLEAGSQGSAADRRAALEEISRLVDDLSCQGTVKPDSEIGSSSSSPPTGGRAEKSGHFFSPGREDDYGTADELTLEMDPEILKEFISESMEHLQSVEAHFLHLETHPDDQETLNAIFRAFHSTKGTANFLGLKDIRDLSHHAETLLDEARHQKILLTGSAADLALQAADTLRDMIAAWKSVTEGGLPPATPVGLGALIARLNDCHENADDQANNAPVKAACDAATPEEPAAASRRVSCDISDSTIRVSLRRMDSLINMVGELVIMHAMIAQDVTETGESGRSLARNVSRLGKITRNLQDLSMAMRMVPLKATFQKMERVARDLARKSGKVIRFVTEGDETEIDRNLVESISDPLVHMIRNAMDHGIEPQAERIKKGKPGSGTILLRAYHSAGNVMIEIRDDGRGLDSAKILAKAQTLGLPGATAGLAETEIIKYIFAPGFSTADQVTDISGRGVGMDVVKKNLEPMHGKVDVTSVPGEGTAFTIRIPLTLAIIDGLLLKVGNQQFIVPTLNVKHAFRPVAAALSTVQGKGEVVRLRDHLIPIFRLHRLFNITGASENPLEAMLLVVEHDGHLCALLIDSLLGQQQVVIKTLGQGLGKIPGVAGAAILGDGAIRLILDTAGVLTLASRRKESVDVSLS